MKKLGSYVLSTPYQKSANDMRTEAGGECQRFKVFKVVRSPVLQTPYAKTRGTRTVQPTPAPWRFQLFLTGHCRATAAL
jgi:hypothetical protein